MATTAQNIFVSKKEKVHCSTCKKEIGRGALFVHETEKGNGLCFDCSPFKDFTFLPAGDVALTRRSKKHSTLCGVVLQWNQRRKRFERLGQYVEAKAIVLAQQECQADEGKRIQANQKAAEKREEQDQDYIQNFARAIRQRYPHCPKDREMAIAVHACEKHSRRVGRTADAKAFDEKMIDLAVIAHVRHIETNYDDQFGKGKRKREIRQDLKQVIASILTKWR